MPCSIPPQQAKSLGESPEIDYKLLAAREAFCNFIHDVLEMRIREAYPEMGLLPVEFSQTNLFIASLPHHLHQQTLDRIIAPQVPLGQHHGQSRLSLFEDEHYSQKGPWKVLCSRLRGKQYDGLESSDIKKRLWSREMIYWLSELGRHYSRSELGNGIYFLRENIRNVKTKAWMYNTLSSSPSPNKPLDGASECTIVEQNDATWRNKLPPLRFSESLSTPKLVETDCKWKFERSVYRRNDCEWIKKPKQNGLIDGLVDGGIDEEGWVRHEGAKVVAPWFLDEPFPCSLCTGAESDLKFELELDEQKEKPSEVLGEQQVGNWNTLPPTLPITPETTKTLLNISFPAEPDEGIAYMQTLTDTLSSFLSTFIKSYASINNQQTPISRSTLLLFKTFPVWHIDETLIRIHSFNRNLGACHQHAPSPQYCYSFGSTCDKDEDNEYLCDYGENTYHPMHDIAFWLHAKSPAELGTDWYHDMFQFMYGVPLCPSSTIDFYVNFYRAKAGILKTQKCVKREIINIWLRDIDRHSLWSGSGDKRIREWGSDLPSFCSADALDELEEIKQLWAEAGNALHVLDKISVGEESQTPRLVRAMDGSVFVDSPSTRGDNRYIKEDEGWFRDQRVWVQDKEGTFFGFGPCMGREYVDGMVDEDGWVHCRKQVHPAFVEFAGIQMALQCKTCKEME